MKENRPLLIGILITIVGFVIVAGIVVLGLRQPVPEPTPLVARPIEDVNENNKLYEIVGDQSQVRFSLHEMLRGVDTEVIGETDQIVGQIAFNIEDLTAVQVGPISINASALTTDNNFRNNTLRNDILQAYFYEQITFAPTDIAQLSQSVGMGDVVAFTITGDLTIRDLTNPVTFAVTAQLVSPERLEGSATATITRADYQLNIPSVSGVADVDNEVILAFDFVAEAVP